MLLHLAGVEWTARRHWLIYGAAGMLAVLATVPFVMLCPPMLSSRVLVYVPASKQIQTQALIAGSAETAGFGVLLPPPGHRLLWRRGGLDLRDPHCTEVRDRESQAAEEPAPPSHADSEHRRRRKSLGDLVDLARLARR